MAFFNIIKGAEFECATVIFGNGTVLPVSSDHQNYDRIIEALLSAADDEFILGLINPIAKAEASLTVLSDRVTRKGNTLLFDGDPMSSALEAHIIRIMDEGDEDGWQAYVNFVEKLYTNPSAESRDHLFAFMQSNGITLYPNGDILLYKGVRPDGTSSHSGYGIVDGVEYENANLPNEIGSVVEIPRSMVDTNRGVACSVGLHAGAYTYASNFASRLLTVAVNPRDVVSVPSDSSDQKVRVSRYRVVDIADAEYGSATFYDEGWTDWDEPAEDEDDEDEEDEGDYDEVGYEDEDWYPGW